ncbi:MAG: phosphatidate cytidylyltransferase [Defluviitaleaceae bacterium]|nr:phosphatidate cytidylyltransferase [Defluviitaleaceae bacterium]
MTTFLRRALTAVIGLPLVIYLVHVGGWALLVVLAALAVIGLREFYIAFSKTDKPIHGIGYFFTGAYFVAIYIFGAGYWLLIALTLFIVTVQACLVVFYKHLPLKECVSTVYGFLYVPFLLSFIALVRQHEYGGHFFVWLIFTASFGCDTFAYLTGVTIGRRRLKNSPSPSKSVEGLVGGIIGAGLVGLIFGFAYGNFSDAFNPGISLHLIALLAMGVSLVGAVFSIIGDMAASAVKRFCEIKDFGNVFPGHGGVLDRIDSVIIVAPIVYIAINILFRLVF